MRALARHRRLTHTSVSAAGDHLSARSHTRRWACDVLLSTDLVESVLEHYEGGDDSELHKFFGPAWPARAVRGGAHSRSVLLRNLKSAQASLRASPQLDLLQPLPALADLAERVGLEEAEVRVLAVLALRDGDRGFRALLDAHTDGLRRSAGLALLASWSGLDTDALESALSRRGKLTRLGLVAAYSGGSFDIGSDHSVSQALLDLLDSGRGSAEELLTACFAPSTPASVSLDDYPHLAAQLPHWCSYLRAAVENRRPGANVLIHGAPGTGKSQLARSLAAAVPAQFFEVRCTDEDGDARPAREILGRTRVAQELLADRPNTLLLLDEADAVLPQSFDFGALFGGRTACRDNKPWLVDMLGSNAVPTIWVANDLDGVHPALLRRFDLILRLDEPPAQVKRRIIDNALDGTSASADLRDRLSRLPGLQPGHVAALARLAKCLPPDSDVDHALRQQCSSLRDLLQLSPMPRAPIQPLGDFRLKWLNPDRPLLPLLERSARLGEARFCLHGPPGTGKTGFAAELARRLDRPLLVRTGAELLSCFVGESEQLIARAFAEAERSNAVLVIDEVESFLLDRRQASHGWQLSQTNALLTALDSFRGVVVLTTNLFGQLDPAVLRRLDHKVEFRAPDAQQRRALWRALGERFGWAMTNEVAPQMDALDGLTPGDFHQVARSFMGDDVGATPYALLHALRAEWRLKRSLASATG